MPPKKTGTTESGSLSTTKLALPAFLKVFTSAGISVGNAMGFAKKVYPTHGSPADLADLDPVKLIELKVDDQDLRKQVLAAVKKSGPQNGQ